MIDNNNEGDISMEDNEIVGADGEFRQAVDTRYGVYSVRKHWLWWRLSLSVVGGLIIASGVVAVWWWL